MTADRARLRELLAEHAKASCQYHFDCEPCGASGLVAALPALLDALDEAEKALRAIADPSLRHHGKYRLGYELAREALARMEEK